MNFYLVVCGTKQRGVLSIDYGNDGEEHIADVLYCHECETDIAGAGEIIVLMAKPANATEVDGRRYGISLGNKKRGNRFLMSDDKTRPIFLSSFIRSRTALMFCTRWLSKTSADQLRRIDPVIRPFSGTKNAWSQEVNKAQSTSQPRFKCKKSKTQCWILFVGPHY